MNILFAAGLQSFFRLIVSLVMFVLVLVACYLTTVWIGRFQKGKMGQGNFEVIEIHRISNQKSLELVRIGKKYYILAVTKDRIEKIDVIEEEEIVLESADLSAMPSSFTEILEKVKMKKNSQEKK